MKRLILFAIVAVLAVVYFLPSSADRKLGIPEAAEKALQELAKTDTRASEYLKSLSDIRSRRAMAAAALAAEKMEDRRARLSDLAQEIAGNNGALPITARLAFLADDPSAFDDPTKREAFINAHLSMAESIRHFQNGRFSADYLSLLEEARQQPSLWPLVYDDPLALVVWDATRSMPLVEFYHRNRDLLAEPLFRIDLSGFEGGPTLEAFLSRLRQFEPLLSPLLAPDPQAPSEEEHGGLGEFGLALIWSHGALLSECLSTHKLDLWDVAAIVHFNPDVFGDMEEGPEWVRQKASLLKEVQTKNALVWVLAQQQPLCLRLYQDAGEKATDVLREYGADMPASLIYSFLGETYLPTEVRLLCESILRFGDMTIYVLANYNGDYAAPVRKYLNHPRIGIRLVPFVLKFGDGAFAKLEENLNWLDKYFDPLGNPIKSWWEDLPGGAAAKIVYNVVNGYPIEWDKEFGWAALDVVDAALIVASFGSAQVATGPARAGRLAKSVARSAKALAQTGARSGRALAKKSWQAIVRNTAKVLPRSQKAFFREVVRQSEKIASMAFRSGAAVVKGAIRYSRAAIKLAGEGIKWSARTWNRLPVQVRQWTLRAVAAAGIFLTIKYRTAPNWDIIVPEIHAGLKKVTNGIAVTAGSALLYAVNEIAKETQRFIRDNPALAALLLGIIVLLLLPEILKIFAAARPKSARPTLKPL